MKKTLEIIEKIKKECPAILGVKPQIMIRPGATDGLIIEARWYCVETYGFSRAYSARAYSASEILNIVSDETLIDGFIYECKRQAEAVEN